MKQITFLLLTLVVAGLTACGDDSSGFIGKTAQNMTKDSLPGAEVTRRECGSCHFLDKAVRKVGPSLKGIYGTSPKTRGVPVEIWDDMSLDAWIENPTEVYPKTRMKVPGIKDAEKRAVIIEYLKSL